MKWSFCCFQLLVLIVLLAHPKINPAQDVVLSVSGKVSSVEGKRLGNTSVILKSEGGILDSVLTASNGKYEISMVFGATYEMYFYCDGYIPKGVVYRLDQGFFAEDFPPEEVLEIPIQLDEGMRDEKNDQSFVGFIVGRIVIDPKVGMLVVDSDYTAMQAKKYKTLLEEMYDE